MDGLSRKLFLNFRHFRHTPQGGTEVHGGRAAKDTTAGMQEVERIRTNIGHIRVKMSGANFPDRVEEVRKQFC